MSKAPHRKNTGMDLLDKSDRITLDSDAAEKIESLNVRTGDSLDTVLMSILNANPGGYVANKQYEVSVPGSSRPDDIVFDRFYFGHKLLVDFMQTPLLEIQKAQMAVTIRRKNQIADDNGLIYMPIIGSITKDEIRTALGL